MKNQKSFWRSKSNFKGNILFQLDRIWRRLWRAFTELHFGFPWNYSTTKRVQNMLFNKWHNHSIWHTGFGLATYRSKVMILIGTNPWKEDNAPVRRCESESHGFEYWCQQRIFAQSDFVVASSCWNLFLMQVWVT